MEEASKKSFRNVNRRYGATLDTVNASRLSKNQGAKKVRKRKIERKK